MNITAGFYKGRKLQVPSSDITRPTLSKVRMAVFNTLQNLIEFEDKSFLDMYSGSGIMALEALSRGFKKIVLIDKSKDALQIIKNNCKTLGVNPEIYFGDSIKTVSKLNYHFNVVYIDPPYFGGIYEKSLEAVKTSDIIIVEHVNSLDMSKFEVLKQKTYGEKTITFLKGQNPNI